MNAADKPRNTPRNEPRNAPADEPQKPAKRTGWRRVVLALRYSLQGLHTGWHEAAFRQEAIAALVCLPAAWWLGGGWLERGALIGAVLAVLVVELLNTAVESAIDRVGPQWHPLSKRAKDLGSAAVFLSLLFCAGLWLGALWAKLMPA